MGAAKPVSEFSFNIPRCIRGPYSSCSSQLRDLVVFPRTPVGANRTVLAHSLTKRRIDRQLETILHYNAVLLNFRKMVAASLNAAAR
jgi:hypothetical protein